MLDRLEIALGGPSQLVLAPASSVSLAAKGEGARVLQYVVAHTMNAVNYSSREATIHSGCCLALESSDLGEELWTQDQLGQALVTLFHLHSAAELERIISLNGHLLRKLKDMKLQQETLRARK